MSEVLDAEVLELLIDAIGAEGTQAVIALFLTECRDLTAAMAAPDADPVEIGRAAHSLKSSSGQLGATKLSAAALAVETAAGTTAPNLPVLIAELTECAAQTHDALAARLK